jgi:hypothetical protein
LEVLLKTEGARVVNISSSAHKFGDLNFDDLTWENRSYSAWRAYGDSKIANLYFTFELDRKLKENGLGLITAAVMEVLDTTIVNVALPQMAGNLSATQEEIAWVSTSYILANVVVLPMTAFFTARFGRKRYPEPVSYPASCSPQAWAAATPLSLLRTTLRFDPSLPTGDVWVAPTSAAHFGDIHLRNVPFAGSRISMDTSRAGTSIVGLPDGITLHHEAAPPVMVPSRRESS